MKFKSEKVKIVAPDGIIYTKMLSEVEIYNEDGTIFKLKDALNDILILKENLKNAEIQLREDYNELYNRLDVRLKKLERIQAEDDGLVLE